MLFAWIPVARLYPCSRLLTGSFFYRYGSFARSHFLTSSSQRLSSPPHSLMSWRRTDLLNVPPTISLPNPPHRSTRKAKSGFLPFPRQEARPRGTLTVLQPKFSSSSFVRVREFESWWLVNSLPSWSEFRSYALDDSFFPDSFPPPLASQPRRRFWNLIKSPNFFLLQLSFR